VPFAHFYELFPEVAREETRGIVLLQDVDGLPAGTYTLTEMFCDEAGCDCRRVVFQVWTEGTPERPVELAATINFG